MGKPRLIILIRHGQSEGNKNREIHQSVPDHRVKLTPDGWTQAYDAGRRLRTLLRPEDTIQVFTSPYRRARETTEGILTTLTSDDPDPSPFQRSNITVFEEPRLREQDFGNFQPCSAEMERMWQERADYGHFFYRIPNGESAADAYDRVAGFNESLWRQFADDDFPSVCVLVTHGLMSRVFLMKWYHFSVEYFEDLRNVNHCEFLIMQRQPDSGKFILESKLRTWSELRRERAALRAKEDQGKEKEKEKEKDAAVLDRQDSLPIMTRQWGGCPEGCNHSQHFRVRSDLAELREHDEKFARQSLPKNSASRNGNGASHGSIANRRPGAKKIQPSSSDDEDDDPRGLIPPQIDVTKAREEVVSSPDGTPSFITIEDRLRGHMKSPQNKPNSQLYVGRDGGGTYSGHASDANSDNEVSEDGARRRLAARAARVKNGEKNGEKNGGASIKDTAKPPTENGKTRVAALANKLGDAPTDSDLASDEGEELEDLDKAEKEDRSLRGSVY